MRMYYTWVDRHYVDSVDVPTMTVASSEPESKFSGLYDAWGNKLYSLQRPEPVGFIHYRDAA